MRYITSDDFVESYVKIRQRGLDFIMSKFNPKKEARTKTAFNTETIDTSNWWNIPMIKDRWNEMISGNPQVNYRQFLMSELLNDHSELRLLSLGSGSCSQEIELAHYPQFKEVVCVDLAENRLKEAERIAISAGLSNMKFLCQDVYKLNLEENSYDIVLFNMSLHHFKDIERLVSKRILQVLKPEGFLVINEYVGPNRLQFPKEQIRAINEVLGSIDRKFRKRYRTNLVKSGYSGPGLLRMVIADPSECVESEVIVPMIHKYFDIVIEKPFGGNILMGVLKDLAYQFIEPDEERKNILKELFRYEDEYLKTHSSDYLFGVYRPK